MLCRTIAHFDNKFIIRSISIIVTKKIQQIYQGINLIIINQNSHHQVLNSFNYCSRLTNKNNNKYTIFEDMRKTRKYLRLQNMRLQLDSVHPKDVSRVHFRLIQQGTGITHQTKLYGVVQPTTIIWSDALEFPYTSQQKMKFQTMCEHQFGYEIQELKAMYNGTLYLKTQNFFQNMSVHVFDTEGTKVGLFKLIIKVIEREQSTAKVTEVQEMEEVKVDLIGRITLYSAVLKITNPIFNQKKHQILSMVMKLGNVVINGDNRSDYKWSFPGKKIQLMENSPQKIEFSIKQFENSILFGQMEISLLQKNKRFLTHQVSIQDALQQKIGVLLLDIRYIDKKEILDLMYSPKKLANSTTQIDTHIKLNPIKHQVSQIVTPKKKLKDNSLHVESISNNQKHQQLHKLLNPSQSIPHEYRSANRYKKVHMINQHNQIIFSRAKRFVVPKSNSPEVAYIDPSKMSDFSPSKRGASISFSNKSDFTRPFKGIPGVGAYKLPSIWDKY